MDFTNVEMQELIDVIKKIVKGEVNTLTENTDLNITGYVSLVNSDGTFDVSLQGNQGTYKGLSNKTGEELSLNDAVTIKAIGGKVGNGYIGVKNGITSNSASTDPELENVIHAGKVADLYYSNEFTINGLGGTQERNITGWDDVYDPYSLIQKIGSYYYFVPPTGSKNFRVTAQYYLYKNRTGGSRMNSNVKIGDAQVIHGIEILSGSTVTDVSIITTSMIGTISSGNIPITLLVTNLNSSGSTTYNFTTGIERLQIEILR